MLRSRSSRWGESHPAVDQKGTPLSDLAQTAVAGRAADHALMIDVVERTTSLLTPEQRAIVEWGDGPLVVIAGAGTGKTRVIVERVR